jgi:hypothetical protein
MAGYYPGAWPEQPQRLVGDARRPAVPAGKEKEFADYLASINLSAVPTHQYPLRTFARPTGRATHVIITEYDLPAKSFNRMMPLSTEMGWSGSRILASSSCRSSIRKPDR